jgi:hypothetical protein
MNFNTVSCFSALHGPQGMARTCSRSACELFSNTTYWFVMHEYRIFASHVSPASNVVPAKIASDCCCAFVWVHRVVECSLLCAMLCQRSSRCKSDAFVAHGCHWYSENLCQLLPLELCTSVNLLPQFISIFYLDTVRPIVSYCPCIFHFSPQCEIRYAVSIVSFTHRLQSIYNFTVLRCPHSE